MTGPPPKRPAILARPSSLPVGASASGTPVNGLPQFPPASAAIETSEPEIYVRFEVQQGFVVRPVYQRTFSRAVSSSSKTLNGNAPSLHKLTSQVSMDRSGESGPPPPGAPLHLAYWYCCLTERGFFSACEQAAWALIWPMTRQPWWHNCLSCCLKSSGAAPTRVAVQDNTLTSLCHMQRSSARWVPGAHRIWQDGRSMARRCAHPAQRRRQRQGDAV